MLERAFAQVLPAGAGEPRWRGNRCPDLPDLPRRFDLELDDDLVGLELKVVVASIETYLRYADVIAVSRKEEGRRTIPPH